MSRRRIFLSICVFAMCFYILACAPIHLNTSPLGLEDFYSQTNQTGILPDADFTGPYPSITTNPYPSDFHGVTTIAELRSMITQDNMSFTGGTVLVKGVITGLGTYGGSFSAYTAWIQDATGGIYIYYGADMPGLDAGSAGDIMEFDVTSASTFGGAPQITGGTVTVRTAAGSEPTNVYVRDISDLSISNAGHVVRWAGTISLIDHQTDSAVKNLVFLGLPEFRANTSDIRSFGIDIGDTVTVIGPLGQYYTTPQIDQTGGFPGGLSQYMKIKL